MVHPQPGECRFSGTRLAREHISTPRGIDNGRSMDLDASPLRQQVDHQQLVERVLQGIDGVAPLLVEIGPIHPHVAGREGRIESSGLVGD